MPNYEQIAKDAEADLNTYQSKTGKARREGLDDAGVNSNAEKKFDGAKVTYGDDLSTNRGDNRRIPPSEGGELDARGRQTHGQDFEGEGGPADKHLPSGENDHDVVGAKVSKADGLGRGGDIARDGQEASQVNTGKDSLRRSGAQFKGEDYYSPESVPDSIAAENLLPPGSVTQASRETEGYEGQPE
ncbi:hypothetical protein G7046_g3653 [Stylonectria norvegica]|nr:hypothetical protein G7046_g3653 [Stylonectria norvegica]